MQNTPDRRAIKGLSKSRLANGDVYPQEPKQDEDNLGSEKLKKGFTTGPCNYEHESVNGIIDRTDAHYRSAQFYMQVIQRKGEINLLATGKKSKDSITTLPVASPMKAKERVQWYQNLAKGKTYASLMQRPPTFKKKEHMFDYFYDFRITPSRAIWNLKLAANIAANHNKKNKTFNGEIFTVEYAHAISRAIRQVFYAMYDLDSLDECDDSNEKWYYFTRLSRSAFDEGVIDRQEFINELCDIFTDIFLRRVTGQIDTLYQLEMWMQYFYYFVPSATQNLVLARRIAVMMCQKLSLMKDEFEEDEEELLEEIREGRYVYAHDREKEGEEGEENQEIHSEFPEQPPRSFTAPQSMNEDSRDDTDPPPPPPRMVPPPMISVVLPQIPSNSDADMAEVVIKKEEEPDEAFPSPEKTTLIEAPKIEPESSENDNIMERKIKEEPLDEDEIAAKEKEKKPEEEKKEEEKKDEEEEDDEPKKIEFDEDHPDKFVFDVMFACPPLRQPINSLVTLLFTCIGEQPGAMVYNKFFVDSDRLPFMLTQLGGSPLDYLPCNLLDLPFDIGDDDAHEAVIDAMEMHEHDIVLRSELVQNQWSLTFHTQRQHAKLIDGCLDVIGFLDSYDILKKGAPEKICERVFLRMKYSRYAKEICTRIRLCLTWAITVQRDGQWRCWLVAKVLKQLLNACPHEEPYGYFGGTHFSLILLEFINHDLPKSGEENYYQEFKNFCSLFFEFTRLNVYTHENLYAVWTGFHKVYCRRMEMDPNDPIMLNFVPVSSEGDAKDGRRKEGDTSVGSEDLSRMEDSETARMDVDEDDSIEIKAEVDADQTETVKSEPKREDNEDEMVDVENMETDKKESDTVSFITLPEEVVEGYRLLDEDIPPLEQLVLQLPIRMEDSHLMNNRTQMLYGNTQTKKVYIEAAKKVADEFIKIIRKKMFTKWCKKSDDVKFTRRSTPQQLKELLQKMRQHLMFDQQLICTWVADGFLNTVKFFTENEEPQLPTFEAFDLVCSLFEQTNNMHGFFKFCLMIIPQLPKIDREIHGFKSVIMPGLVVSQYTYVICSYLVKHLHYFVHYERAIKIVNFLYRVMEKSLKAADYPRNGFGRAASACIYHLREQLIRSEVVDSETMLGEMEEFTDVFEQGEVASMGQKTYNKMFMMDNFQNTTLRIYMYSDFKKRLPSFRDSVNQYSFVVNAFVAASKMQRDFDRLSELASFCSHWTAHHPEMANDWMGAFRALCAVKSNHLGFHHLLDQVDVSDCSLHYSISTFAVLLASKYCYSIPKMISELINTVFSSVLKKESGRSARGTSYKDKTDYENEPNVCIALLYLAQMSCASDDPFILSEHYRGRSPVRKLLEMGSADLNILSMVHWCELDRVVFPMIANVGIMHDTLQARVRDHDLKLEVPEGPETSTRREYKKEFLPLIVRQVLTSICEQDWVKNRIYKIAQMEDMAAFNQDRLKQNCLGQQLLRLGTRRRCEREILAQLSVCNGNSKKALIDKLFSVLSIWNFRATLFDLRLMIKEKSPEGSNKNAQQGAIAAEALMGEIAKCCRELFVQAFRQNKIILKKDERFSFSSITNYVLIPTLIDLCPTPSNMPSAFSATFKSKFLTEVCNMLDVGTEPNNDKLKMSAWLINDRSFLNIIMACMKGSTRDDQTAKDTFMSSLLKQIQDLSKIKENPLYHYQTAHGEERKGIFHRIQLVAYIFDEVCKSNTAEGWALILFQLMLHGVITPLRNMLMYNKCFDMLSSIIMWSLTDESASAVVPMTEKNGQEGDKKFRFPNYMGIVKKLRKELHDTKTMMETKNLHAFLPLPKNIQQMLSFEPFGTQPSNSLNKLRIVQQANIGLRRGRPCLQIKKNAERIRITAFEMLQAYNPDNTNRKFPGLNFYMAGHVDISMVHPYRVIQRMMGHIHPQYGWVHNPLQLDEEAITDVFLNQIAMDNVGEPPWVTKKKEKEKREKAEKEKKEKEANADPDKEKKDADDDGVKKEIPDEEEVEKEKEPDRERSVATPAALAGSDIKPTEVEVKKEIKEEEIVVLDSPSKSSVASTPLATSTPINDQSELAKVMAQPLQASSLAAHLPTSALANMVGPPGGPAPVKATRRRSTAKDGAPAEKKERKKPIKRNAAGLTLQTTANPPLMATPPKGGILGGPMMSNQMGQQGMCGSGQSSQQPGAPPAYLAGTGTDWNQSIKQEYKKEQYNPPQHTQSTNGPTTTLSQLMGHTQAAPSTQQPTQHQPQLQQQLHLQQKQATSSASQQPSHQGMSQMQGGTSQQAQHQQMMAQMQQNVAQNTVDHNEGNAKTRLQDFIHNRQENKAAHLPPDYVSPQKNPAPVQKRSDAPHPGMGHQSQSSQSQQQQQPAMMSGATSSQMGQPGMMQQQPRATTHEQTNRALASHINAKAHHNAVAAGQSQPTGSQQPYSQQYPQGSQQSQPANEMLRDAPLPPPQRGPSNPAAAQSQQIQGQQQRSREMQQQQIQMQQRAQQQRSSMPGQTGPSAYGTGTTPPDASASRDPTMGQPPARLSGGSRAPPPPPPTAASQSFAPAPQPSSSFPTQSQSQYDTSYGAPPSKIPAMGSGTNPYPNRPGAPTHNQSTNQPSQQTGSGQTVQPGYQAYPQQSQPQLPSNPTPQQMERLKMKQQQQALASQQQQQQQGQPQQRMQTMQRTPSQGMMATAPQQPQSISSSQSQQQQQRLQQQQFQQAQQQVLMGQPQSDASRPSSRSSQQQSQQQFNQRQYQQQYPQ